MLMSVLPFLPFSTPCALAESELGGRGGKTLEEEGNFLEEVFPPPPNLPLSSRTFPKTTSMVLCRNSSTRSGTRLSWGKFFIFREVQGLINGLTCRFVDWKEMVSRHNRAMQKSDSLRGLLIRGCQGGGSVRTSTVKQKKQMKRERNIRQKKDSRIEEYTEVFQIELSGISFILLQNSKARHLQSKRTEKGFPLGEAGAGGD